MLRLEDGRIAEAHFLGQSYTIRTASTSGMTDLIAGKAVAEALELGVLAKVHMLPARVKGATLARNALEQALAT